MAYIPFNRLIPNQLYLLSAVLAHNLSREFQMSTSDKKRNTTFKRIQLWPFQHIGTIRRNIINRAGRLIEPSGVLTLTVSADPKIAQIFTSIIEYLTKAA
jgi:hypothetical protein